MKTFLASFAALVLLCGSAFAQSQDTYGTTTLTIMHRPALISATYSNATGVDLSGYVGQPAVVLVSTNTFGTNPTADVQLQNATTATGTYAAFGAAFTQITTNGILTLPLDTTSFQGSNFFRIYIIIGGTTTTNCSSAFVIGRKKYN